MALPKALHPSLTPQELTFIAEEEHIEIIPAFSMSRVRLISGMYGPFIPPGKAKVPLWLALSLKRKRKCRIVCPEWLTADNLQAIVTAEKDNPDSFVALPRNYIEVSKLLLDIASTDLQNPSAIHSLLLTLRHIRLSKIRTALRPPPQSSTQATSRDGVAIAADLGPFSGGGEYLRLTGLTPFEVAEMKGFLRGVMGSMRGLSGLKPGGEDADQEEDNEDMEY